MRRRAEVRGRRVRRVVPVLAVLAWIGACGGPERGAPPDAGRSDSLAVDPATGDSKGREAAVQRVYRCGDDRFEVLVRGDSAWVFLPERTAVLRRSASASGAGYAGEGVVYSPRAEETVGEAVLEVDGRPRTDCRTVGSRSAWAEALLRGVDFRALGQEPGWILEIHRGDSIVLRYDYGRRRAVAPAPRPEAPDGAEPTGRRVYRTSAGGRTLTVSIEEEPCRDAMSGFGFPATVTVRLEEIRLRGCGRPLR